MALLTCSVCSKQFTSSYGNAKVCSVSCRRVRTASYLRSYYPGVVATERECKRCGAKFFGKGNKKYCRNQCRLEDVQDSLNVTGRTKNCLVCGVEFTTNRTLMVCCSRKCAAKRGNDRLQEIRSAKIKIKTVAANVKDYTQPPRLVRPRSSYVYGWYDPKCDLPFYIGKGVGDRAWVKHLAGDKTEAVCERFRTDSTRVVIFRDNLTDEGATLVESVLINVFRSLGAPLMNDKEPTSRLEIPPLTRDTHPTPGNAT